ncbi:MAG: acetyl-CoA carboxylase carboxyl transferase subunit alpha, partial [Planctomycetaceae bacterium]
IAENILGMFDLPVPIVCVVIGEGGSGGALGIGVGDRVLMLQYSYYSVISPEGCAGILWKHVDFREQAAKALKFTSSDLSRLGVIDEVIPEPLGAAHRDHRQMAMAMKASLNDNIRRLSEFSIEELLSRRYDKFRQLGVFEETTLTDSEPAAGS